MGDEPAPACLNSLRTEEEEQGTPCLGGRNGAAAALALLVVSLHADPSCITAFRGNVLSTAMGL